jgi:hypothetical protein
MILVLNRALATTLLHPLLQAIRRSPPPFPGEIYRDRAICISTSISHDHERYTACSATTHVLSVQVQRFAWECDRISKHTTKSSIHSFVYVGPRPPVPLGSLGPRSDVQWLTVAVVSQVTGQTIRRRPSTSIPLIRTLYSNVTIQTGRQDRAVLNPTRTIF